MKMKLYNAIELRNEFHNEFAEQAELALIGLDDASVLEALDNAMCRTSLSDEKYFEIKRTLLREGNPGKAMAMIKRCYQ